jgi:catechol 2,3-dioxygenase-like lactoylglutathione lyase family enzyme
MRSSSFTRILKRSLLSALVFATVVVSPQLQATSQIPAPNRSHTSAQVSQKPPIQHAVIAVESVGMTVSDMDRAIEFYTQVLSFQKVSDVEVLGMEYEQLQGIFGVRLRIVRMQLGDEFIDLTEYLTPKGRPIPIDSRSHDRWFQHIAIVVSDMDKAYQYLRRYKVQHASTAPQRLPESIKGAAGIRAFYFKDPDGHNLEIIYFPPDKGDPKWHKPTKRLFLGIDHTAIVVANTATSLKFYQDLLGLKLAGESMNEGIEQAHLNNVEGARLRISGLRSPSGPGIEFLEYLHPQDGRPYPADARPNDLLHWQTTLVVKNLTSLTEQLRLNQLPFVSTGIVSIPEPAIGFKKGILVRDPDGHVVRLIEK